MKSAQGSARKVRPSLRERLARMTPDELRHALQVTRRNDETIRARFLSRIVDDRAEVLEILLDDECLAKKEVEPDTHSTSK